MEIHKVKTTRCRRNCTSEKGRNLINDSKGKAELLLDQFKSVFTKATDNTLPKTKIQAKTDISPIKIEQKDLEKLLRQVKPNKASGPDTMPNRILKECAESIAPILQIILQQSLDMGDLVFFQMFKHMSTDDMF